MDQKDPVARRHVATDKRQMNGKNQHIKCLSKVLGHKVLPKQLQCALALILQVSEHY